MIGTTTVGREVAVISGILGPYPPLLEEDNEIVRQEVPKHDVDIEGSDVMLVWTEIELVEIETAGRFVLVVVRPTEDELSGVTRLGIELAELWMVKVGKVEGLPDEILVGKVGREFVVDKVDDPRLRPVLGIVVDKPVKGLGVE